MMNSWQEWVVALLLLLCAVRIGMSIYSFFHRVKENGNPCDSCASGCELKNLYDKNLPGTPKNKTPKLLFKSVSEFFVIGNCLPIL